MASSSSAFRMSSGSPKATAWTVALSASSRRPGSSLSSWARIDHAGPDWRFSEMASSTAEIPRPRSFRSRCSSALRNQSSPVGLLASAASIDCNAASVFPARAARLAIIDLSSAVSIPMASSRRRSTSAAASPILVSRRACSRRISGSSGVMFSKPSRCSRSFSSSPDSLERRQRLRRVAG